MRKTTAYFDAMRLRQDRASIELEWIERAIEWKFNKMARRWKAIDEMSGRYLRVILLPDGETLHNAFFDRGFKP